MEQILGDGGTANEDVNVMHMVGLNIARLMSTTSGLGDGCLDATLGYVFADETYFRAFLAGDGAIAALKKSGEKWAAIIEYPSGAPPYLSYSLDEDRTQLYLKATNGCPFTIDTYEWEASIPYEKPEMVMPELYYKETIEDEGMHSHFFAFPRDEYDLIMVMSDGICSFQKPKNSETTKYFEPVDPIGVIDDLLDVKSPKGDFIKRRCKRVMKNLCLKAGWKHIDDFSVAAIHSGE